MHSLCTRRQVMFLVQSVTLWAIQHFLIWGGSPFSQPPSPLQICTDTTATSRRDLALPVTQQCSPPSLANQSVGMFVNPPFALFAMVQLDHHVGSTASQPFASFLIQLSRPSTTFCGLPMMVLQQISGTTGW